MHRYTPHRYTPHRYTPHRYIRTLRANADEIELHVDMYQDGVSQSFRIEDSCEDSTRQIQMYGLFATGNEAETQQLQVSCACREQHHNVAYIQCIGMILKVTWK